ncbi:hemocytin [Caerostris extrusa]|uniref:Hemocytin n=1 Tax=Caerostris extrusa TaxID=172846 RepID=A0AAV4VYG2_CAEEX|nr:hemocytin [Caerostris extrusa]
MGGDCDCLCTAIAAYAQECSIHGVSIKWRSQELCPIQCEECSTYDTDFCVEGCNPKPCPAGQIYNNEIEYKCIPEVDCVVPCLEINGVIYNEVIAKTEKLNALGPLSYDPTSAALLEDWLDSVDEHAVFVGGDYEDLTNSALRTTYEEFCGVTNMTGIECRVAETKTPWQETGQNLICELPTGLMCNDIEQNHQICEDFEIRVFCDCGPMIETTTMPESTTQFITQAPECHHTGWSPWMSSVLPNERVNWKQSRGCVAITYFVPITK